MTMFDNDVSIESTATETPAEDVNLFDEDTDTENESDEPNESDIDSTDDTEETSEDKESEDSENVEEKPEQNSEKPTTYKLKHLSEEKEVTLEEMQILAQKGMDYDHVRQGLDEYKQFFKELAQDSDMTPDEFLAEYRKEMQEAKIQQRVEEIMESELVDEKIAERLARAEIENEAIKRGKEIKDRENAQKEEAEKQSQEAIIRDIQYLQKIRPEVASPDFKVPEEVLKRMNEDGTPLSTAYLGWIAEQTETKLKKIEQAEKNRQKNVGSMKSTATSKQDGFVDALFGD